LHLRVAYIGSMVSDHLKSASIGIREKLPMKNIEERLVGLAVMVASEQTLHLCRVVG